MPSAPRQNARRAAAFIITRWLLTHAFPADLLPMQGADRAFIQDLVYTTVRRFRPLRTVLGQLVSKQWPKGELEALLLIGGAQILYMPDVKDFAAVNETVDAAKYCDNPSIARVVNGVLRNLIRRREAVEAELAAAPLAERESFPNALVNRWIARYGAENAEKLARWHNTPAETWLAYPPNATLPEGAETDAAHSFVRLPRGQRVTDQPGFNAGAFLVQDPATAASVALLDVHPGQSVLDACAAPGGKTVQIAWRLNPADSRLVAVEINSGRLRRLSENLKRMKQDWVETSMVLPPHPDFPSGRNRNGLFDRVLVDAPCSNTGVLRRRPDARWRWDAEHLKQLTDLQSEILSRVAPFVAPGGILVYSTCSNEPEENADQIAAFLASHPSFTEIRRTESVPFESGHDGAFACALRRN